MNIRESTKENTGEKTNKTQAQRVVEKTRARDDAGENTRENIEGTRAKEH